MSERLIDAQSIGQSVARRVVVLERVSEVDDAGREIACADLVDPLLDDVMERHFLLGAEVDGARRAGCLERGREYGN